MDAGSPVEPSQSQSPIGEDNKGTHLPQHSKLTLTIHSFIVQHWQSSWSWRLRDCN